jgi:AAA+ ATPase superfamily predicted ATPase
MSVRSNYKVKTNPNFVGRKREIQKLRSLDNGGEAKILVVHGRRRVGKTELIEQFFRDRNLLKFEGIEP